MLRVAVKICKSTKHDHYRKQLKINLSLHHISLAKHAYFYAALALYGISIIACIFEANFGSQRNEATPR